MQVMKNTFKCDIKYITGMNASNLKKAVSRLAYIKKSLENR